MGRKSSKQSPAPSTRISRVPWAYTKCMNATDLSRDDDYLSHLFIEKVSSVGGITPLLVHRMNPERRLPKTDSQAVLNIIQRITHARQNERQVIKLGVSELFEIHSVLYFIQDYKQKQINAFATHASRYLELYLPNGSIEIAQTTRYSRITGKNELCILATRPMPAGFLISELKGSLAELTDDEDRELKNPSEGIDGGRRDFSVIHSKQLKKNHLFLGPARFVNHDCDNNCELFRDGRYITFRTIKPIALGQELTAHYGEGYFGKNNRHCLCETCERRGKGGYAPQVDDNAESSTFDNGGSDSENDSDSDTSSAVTADSGKKVEVNLNERRTRRGVYRVIQESEGSDEDEEVESVDDLLCPRESLPDAPASSRPTSPELASSRDASPNSSMLLSLKRRGRPSKDDPELASAPVTEKTSFKSVITTRGQKAREASMSSSPSQGRSASAVSENTGTSGCAFNLRSRRSESAVASMSMTQVTKPRGRPRKYPLPEGSTSFQVKEETPVDTSLSTRGRSSTALKAIAMEAVTPDKEVLKQKKAPSVPSCMTCVNPLPAEDIEDVSPVKGKGKGKSKAKAKEIEKDCQRCARHLAIWGARWPHRIPTSVSYAALTRENTPSDYADSVSRTSVSAVDMRLAAARFAQLRLIKELEQEAQVRAESIPSKGLVAGMKRKRREMAPEIDPRTRAVKPCSLVKTVNVRGAKVKDEHADEVPLHGPIKKRAIEEITKSTINGARGSSASRKRNNSRPPTTDEAAACSEDQRMDDEYDDRRDKTFWPALPPLPPVGEGIKRTGLLNLRPNPNLVSRWRTSPLRAAHSSDSTPTLIDDDTDETASDGHPPTPENNGGATPEVVDEAERQARDLSVVCDLPPLSDEDEEVDDDGDVVEKKKSVSTLKGLGLISRPNPLVLSKRIWAPPALIADPDCEELTHPSSPEQRRPKRRRKIQEMDDQRMVVDSVPSSPTDRTSLSDLSIRAFESRVKKGMFDDFDVSSGEEDVILPGPSNSKLYLLHNKAFSTPDSTRTPLRASPAPETERTAVAIHHTPPSVTLTSSPSLAKILNQPVLTLGPLHSDFLPPSPVPVRSPMLVTTSWDAWDESDTSA